MKVMLQVSQYIALQVWASSLREIECLLDVELRTYHSETQLTLMDWWCRYWMTRLLKLPASKTKLTIITENILALYTRTNCKSELIMCLRVCQWSLIKLARDDFPITRRIKWSSQVSTADFWISRSFSPDQRFGAFFSAGHSNPSPAVKFCSFPREMVSIFRAIFVWQTRAFRPCKKTRGNCVFLNPEQQTKLLKFRVNLVIIVKANKQLTNVTSTPSTCH